MPIANTCSIGYPHDGRADNAAYRHDRRADKRRYQHDRRADSLSRFTRLVKLCKCSANMVMHWLNRLIFGTVIYQNHHETPISSPYLGITISNDLQWKTHITNIVKKKANSTLGFLRRNPKYNPMECKRLAYIALVRSTL